jgi:transcriptional regulator with XRE-family HTH domain
MDLFEKNKATEPQKDEGYIHEQLSLDLDLTSEAPAAENKSETDVAVSETPEEPGKSAFVPEVEAESKSEKSEPVKKEKENKIPEKETVKKKDRKKKKRGIEPEEAFLNIGVGSFGKYLQDMRVRNNYSIAQVEQITRIKGKYIEHLENEKPGLELPAVYMLAYARKLCACYNVPEAETAGLIKELKNKMRDSMPPEIIENIKIDYEIDEDNQRKLKHFTWMFVGGIFFFVVLVGIAVYILFAPSKSSKPETPAAVKAEPMEKFNPEKLKALQHPVMIEASELPPKQ